MKLIIVLALVFNTAFAAQDHNSSRSNKTASIAADLSDQSSDFSRTIQYADTEEYTKGARDLMKEVSAMEVRTNYMRAQLTIGIFANLLLKEAQALRCRSLEDKECIDRAIQSAEAKTLKKTKHDTTMNSIQNVR